MNQEPDLPNYNEITEQLHKAGVDITASEVHGLICGIITTSSEDQDDRWEKLILGSKKNKKASALLQHIYAVSFHQLSEFSFEFNLLVPDDNNDINDRTECLGLWCQGFLTGLEQGKTPINATSPEAAEALDDITEIAQVNYGDMDESDDNETSYFELLEYVRLAVLMLFQEFRTKSPHDFTDEDLLN